MVRDIPSAVVASKSMAMGGGRPVQESQAATLALRAEHFLKLRAHLLIVECDQELAASMSAQMATFGHTSETAICGASAWQMLTTRKYDVVLLDRSIPTLDGIAILHEIRSANISVSVLMLSALGHPTDQARALNAGADDYIVKPVDPEELDARINVQLRARNRSAASEAEIITVGELTIHPMEFLAFHRGNIIRLQNIELKILLVLANNSGHIVTRAMLFKQVWGYETEPSSNLAEVYIRRLRRKLKESGGGDPIRTIRGTGYMLQA